MLDYIRIYYIDFQYGYAYAITNIMFTVCTILLLNNIPKGFKQYLYKFIEIMIGFLVLIGLNGVYYGVTGEGNSNFIELVFIILYATLFSKYNISTRVVISSIFYCTNLLSLTISSAVTLGLREKGYMFVGEINKFDITSIIVIILFSIMLIFLKKFTIENLVFIPNFYALLIVIVSAISFIIFNLDLKDILDSVYMVVISVSFWSLDILSYWMFYLISRDYNEKLNLTVLKHKAEAECQQFRSDMKNYEEMRMLRHELKNYFSYAEILLEQKEYKKLQSYFSQVQDKVINSKEHIDCGNIVVSSIINNMVAKVKELGIKLETDIEVPNKLAIEESELYSLISNIIENAIEACIRGDCEDSIIKVSIKQKEAYLFVRVSNPISDDIPIAERLKLETVKVNKQMHGYGTKIIKKIVEKNNGYIKYNVVNNNFIVDAMLESDSYKGYIGGKGNDEIESCSM